jgi:hypothetical protein
MPNLPVNEVELENKVKFYMGKFKVINLTYEIMIKNLKLKMKLLNFLEIIFIINIMNVLVN